MTVFEGRSQGPMAATQTVPQKKETEKANVTVLVMSALFATI